MGEVAEMTGTEVEPRSLLLHKNVKRSGEMMHTCNLNMQGVETGGLDQVYKKQNETERNEGRKRALTPMDDNVGGIICVDFLCFIS